MKEHHALYRYGLTEDWSPTAREEYRATFTSDELKLGEFTPYYLRASWICELAADVLPQDSPIIVLVRDPIDRFASALRHEMTVVARVYRRRSQAANSKMNRVRELWAGRRHQPSKPDVFEMTRGRVQNPAEMFRDNTWLRAVGSDASWGGMYAAQLAAWTAVLPKERFIVIQYEKLRQDPQRYTDHVWKRIGLEPVSLKDVDERKSATDNEMWQRNYGLEAWLPEDYPHVVRALQQMYRPDAEWLASEFDIDLALWKRTMADA